MPIPYSIGRVGDSVRSWREIVCQPRLPQLGHRPQVHLLPFAFQRIPPRSQIDRSNPHDRQRTIQARDSASIDVAQDRGASLVISCWVRLTATGSPSSSNVFKMTECSIVALGQFPQIHHARMREAIMPAGGAGHAQLAQARLSGRAKLDALFSRMRHSCGAGCSARAVKAKERSSGRVPRRGLSTGLSGGSRCKTGTVPQL
jgi:hypothetical protein